MSDEERNELIRKILQVCAACSKSRWIGRGLICDQSKGKCNSKKVQQWLKQIEELEKQKGR